MDTPQQSVETASAPRSHRVRTTILFVIVVAVFIALGWLAYNTLFQPTPPAAEEEISIETPDLTTMDQVGDYTGDKELPEADPSIRLKPFDDKDHIWGSETAPYSIIEYSNFGNRYAALFHPELRKIVDSSNGQVQWVFRHFPMSESDFVPQESSECVFRQMGNPGFWTYFDAAFAQADRSAGSLGTMAEQAGVDRTLYDACMNDHLGRSRVIGQGQDAALDANVTVSPTYILHNNVTGESRMASGLNTVEYINATLAAMR